MSQKAIIIGAGIGGIACAIRLAVKGFEVQVYEANSYPGGKLSELNFNGFRFDAGPSLFTLPHLVDELFKLAGKNPHDYFQYDRLDIICKYFWDDFEGAVNAYSDKEKFASEIEQKLGVDRLLVLKHLKKSAQIYEWTKDVFLERSLHKLATYTNKKTLSAILKLPFIGLNKTMHEANSVFNNNKLTQLFNRFATYNGSNPYEARATLNTISHLEHSLGAFAPKGGMYQITNSLFNVSKDLGVQFTFSQKVKAIKVEDGIAKGIEIEDKLYKADLIVSNADVFPTYKNLLSNEKHPETILNRGKSSSALIFYWGMKQELRDLAVHNIFFSKNYKKEFDCIFKEKTVCDDPTVYVNIASKYNKADAPDGCECWFVMINVPSNEGQDWDEIIERSRNNIINKISKKLNLNISEYIVAEQILDPRSIEAKTASHKGALYGSHSNELLSAFLRHPNFSRKIKNLYFVGGSVHPGGGIPLCLLSAKIVDGLLDL